MSARKTPPPYTWIPAPLGWWLKGKYNRKLCHVWLGSDGKWRGFTFGPDGNPLEVEATAFPSEEAALEHYFELLAPKPKEKDS